MIRSYERLPFPDGPAPDPKSIRVAICVGERSDMTEARRDVDVFDVLDDNLGMSFKTLEHEVARLPESDREQAEDAVTAVGTVLIQDTNALMHVARLVRPDMADDEPRSDTAQEARNLRRVFAL